MAKGGYIIAPFSFFTATLNGDGKFTPGCLLSGKEPPETLDARLSGPQSRLGNCGVEQISATVRNLILGVR
jgi:hypothetical protein